MKNRFFILLAFLSLCLLPTTLFGAGAILVDTEGTGLPILWKDGAIRYNLENSPEATLGSLTNEEALALVRELFEDWKNITINGVSTASIAIEEGAALELVNVSNLDSYFTYCPPDESCPGEDPPFVQGSARSGQSPILFDPDGSLTDAVQGRGASDSILGFAGPRVVEATEGVQYITEGQAILNGKFIDGVDSSSNPEVTVDQFKGAIFHELGHFMGIDHTQVNLASVVKYLNGDTSEKDAIPTMLPLFIDGESQLSPHFDDKVALSFLYPSAAFSSSFCRLQGVVFESDGSTELQGVNVLASNGDDLLAESTSFVSGSHYSGSYPNCTAPFGEFTLYGISPGKSYQLRYEKISASFTGGSSIEPCDPAQTGFDSQTISGNFSCDSAAEVITTGTQTTTNIITSKSSTTATNNQPSVDSSSQGCSLIPLD